MLYKLDIRRRFLIGKFREKVYSSYFLPEYKEASVQEDKSGIDGYYKGEPAQIKVLYVKDYTSRITPRPKEVQRIREGQQASNFHIFMFNKRYKTVAYYYVPAEDIYKELQNKKSFDLKKIGILKDVKVISPPHLSTFLLEEDILNNGRKYPRLWRKLNLNINLKEPAEPELKQRINLYLQELNGLKDNWFAQLGNLLKYPKEKKMSRAEKTLSFLEKTAATSEVKAKDLYKDLKNLERFIRGDPLARKAVSNQNNRRFIYQQSFINQLARTLCSDSKISKKAKQVSRKKNFADLKLFKI